MGSIISTGISIGTVTCSGREPASNPLFRREQAMWSLTCPIQELADYRCQSNLYPQVPYSCDKHYSWDSLLRECLCDTLEMATTIGPCLYRGTRKHHLPQRSCSSIFHFHCDVFVGGIRVRVHFAKTIASINPAIEEALTLAKHSIKLAD